MFKGEETNIHDVDSARIGLRTPPHHVDIDLTTARTSGDGSALYLDVAGTSFAIDARSTGNLEIEVQNQFMVSDAPIRCYAGFKMEVVFTRLKITNRAQRARSARLIYATDRELAGGMFAIGGRVPVELDGYRHDVANTGGTITSGIYNATALVAGTPLQIVDPAVNVNGIRLERASVSHTGTTLSNGGYVICTGIALPVSFADGATKQIFGTLMRLATSYNAEVLYNPVFIAPGMGVWVVCEQAIPTHAVSITINTMVA